ncbi:3-hydroxyacyl-CoA dehydrogenase NAD-binding domain-containing protein [soil metagenome]
MSHLSLNVAEGVATVTLDSEVASVNTVSPGWIAEMTETFANIKSDPAITGVILTSAKVGFMAGADLNYILDQAPRMSLKDAFDFSQRATALHRLIETCGKPVVAALNGFALGGGYELALACHHRIVVDDPKAVVGLPEVKVGLLPGSGGTQRLPRLIGVNKALDLLLEGSSHQPADALGRGLVDQVVPVETLITSALAWLATQPSPVQPWDRKGYSPDGALGLLDNTFANSMTMRTAALSARYGALYPASIAILTCVFEGVQSPIDAGLRIESRHFARLIVDPVARNIIRTTFVNKRLAAKGLRRPANVPQTLITKVGVLGAGLMGAGIAHVAANAGLEVVLLDMTSEAAAKGKAYSERILTKQVSKSATTEAKAAALLKRIVPTTDYADLAGCDLIVEAVFEDTAVKADVLRKAEAHLGPDVVFATNTSTLPISMLAQASARPDRFIGLHFFSPVERMELVEVILGARTSDGTLAAALDFIGLIRKTPIIVNDSRGFYTSRVFQTFIHEGAAMLAEGVLPALIENAAKSVGMPMGPLALLDEVTVDLPLKIVDQAIAEVGASYTTPVGAPAMRRMKDDLGRSGRKSGGGFYDYTEDGKRTLWAGLAEAFPLAETQPSVDELGRRFLYVQALETARCLEDGVLVTAADADIGAVLGWGFPTWTGGTLSLIDTVGAAAFVEDCDRLAQRLGERFKPTSQLRAMAQAQTRFHAPCAA